MIMFYGCFFFDCHLFKMFSKFLALLKGILGFVLASQANPRVTLHV